jgi:uncharacterized sporulation protein YeaH/YhbH (DUF444 family)
MSDIEQELGWMQRDYPRELAEEIKRRWLETKAENERLREALEDVLDGWTANIETDDATDLENALSRARAALDREGGDGGLLSEDHESIKIVKHRRWPDK